MIGVGLVHGVEFNLSLRGLHHGTEVTDTRHDRVVTRTKCPAQGIGDHRFVVRDGKANRNTGALVNRVTGASDVANASNDVVNEPRHDDGLG